jgi:hypothetical protein
LLDEIYLYTLSVAFVVSGLVLLVMNCLERRGDVLNFINKETKTPVAASPMNTTLRKSAAKFAVTGIRVIFR